MNRREQIEMGDYVTCPDFPGARGFVNGVNGGIVTVDFNGEMFHEFMQIPYGLAVKCGFRVVEKWYDRIAYYLNDPIKYPPEC